MLPAAIDLEIRIAYLPTTDRRVELHAPGHRRPRRVRSRHAPSQERVVAGLRGRNGLGPDRGRAAPDRASRRRGLDPADERWALVVGRHRARVGLGDARRRGGSRRSVRARPALPAGRERLRRRDGRPDGPVRRVVRRRRVGALPRLPLVELAPGARCRPASSSSCCTPGRRGRSRAPSTTSGAASARRPSPRWPGSIRRSAACATSRRRRSPPRPAGSTPVEFRRARHIVSENDRVGATVAALEAGDLEAVGRALRGQPRLAARRLRSQLARARRDGRHRGLGARRDRGADDRCRLRWLHGQPGPTGRRGRADRGGPRAATRHGPG